MGVSPFRRSTVGLALTLALGGLLAVPAAAENFKVLLADGRTLENVSLKPGPSAGQVVLQIRGSEPVTVRVEDLLAVDFGKVQGRPVKPTLRMANGDQVFGKLSFPAAGQVKVAAGWGELTVPLARCGALRLNDTAELPGPVTRDVVILPNDRVQGTIQGIAANKITINLGSGVVPVPLERVQAIALAPRPAPAAEDRSGVLLALDLGAGERLTGRWVKLGPEALTVRMDWGATVDVPLTALSSLEVKNGKLVYLSDLKPTETRVVPYLDEALAPRVNQSVSGRPLRLRGKQYARGIGMHSRTELTYALDGGFASFAATLGIDDAVAGHGSVVYRLYGDDKLLYESPVARGGDAPLPVKVPIKGVLLLRLQVDYADGGDAADHADLADARLLRE